MFPSVHTSSDDEFKAGQGPCQVFGPGCALHGWSMVVSTGEDAAQSMGGSTKRFTVFYFCILKAINQCH